tara:strand:- start:1428 stop:2087 length:660 start_codon:yes stop_codon:yes gene_type:complete
MKDNSILNKVRELLGMEVKLETRKLDDSTTTVEAESFEKGEQIMIVTEDEQKIALPMGEYKMESGEMLIVKEEGIIDEIKAEEKEEEEVIEEDAKKEEEMYEEEVEASEEVKPVKKTVESIVKETFFSEIEALKTENEELKAEIELLSKVSTDENTNAEVETTEEVKEEVELAAEETIEEPAAKPITHNPENKKKTNHIQYSANRQRTTLDRVMEKLSK